ncbi:MAG TPA: SURF1 family protein [Steroidobacteraceae bacterium]|nr:SURF1 family protein [Steroidobacteraceae bacterium]
MRIANRNFAPTLFGVALTIAGVLLFVRLGFWQLDRMAEKDALQAKYAAGQRSVVELTAANAATLTQYQRVSARGRYDSAHQILLDSMPSAMGQPGYRVVTPFELEQGGWVLVDRGWHRPGATRADLPDVGVGEGVRTVVGQLSLLPRPGVRLAAAPASGGDKWPRVLNYPEQTTVEQALDRKVVPGLVLLDRDQPDGFERVWQARMDMGSERHLSYAVQWFGFAIAAIALFVVLGFRRGQLLDEQSK